MRISLITNIKDEKGLWRDALTLKRILLASGHSVEMVDFRLSTATECDLAIFLEVVAPRFFGICERRWWIPNPEWTLGGYLSHIGQFEYVLCKTKDAKRIFDSFTSRAIFSGFTSDDVLDTSIEREKVFFHACRGSLMKGTQAVVSAAQELGYPVVIARSMGEIELRKEQNRCLFHLCPSEYEGWGHSIHEGLCVGGIVVSTDLPPMNEMPGIAKLVEISHFKPMRLAITGKANIPKLKDAMRWCMGLDSQQIEEYTSVARTAFETESIEFEKIIGELLALPPEGLPTLTTPNNFVVFIQDCNLVYPDGQIVNYTQGQEVGLETSIADLVIGSGIATRLF